MKLRQLGSNQAQVEINDNLTVFFSYDTPVACFIRDQGYFRSEKRWSVTTTQHINKWLDGVKAEGRPQEFFDTALTFSPTNFADRVRAELSGQHNPDLLAALKLILAAAGV